MIMVNHTWLENGVYKLRAKAKDVNGLESGWSELEILLSRNKASNIPTNILSKLFQLYPIFQKMFYLFDT